MSLSAASLPCDGMLEEIDGLLSRIEAGRNAIVALLERQLHIFNEDHGELVELLKRQRVSLGACRGRCHIRNTQETAERAALGQLRYNTPLVVDIPTTEVVDGRRSGRTKEGT